MNRWILSQGELVGSFDVLWSEGSRITDPDPDHLRGTHDSVGHVNKFPWELNWEKNLQAEAVY